MKRTLSLVLALVMVLGSFSAVFAAEEEVVNEAAEILYDLGILREYRLDDQLERRDAVILLARLLGEEEEAKEFEAEGYPTWEDNTDPFYDGYLAWAEVNGYFEGVAEGKFSPRTHLTAQDFLLVLLRALGYDVKGHDAWKKALETAEEAGLLVDLEVEEKDVVSRGLMAVLVLNTLKAEVVGEGVTLAEKLGYELPEEVPTTIEVVDVYADNLKQIVVEFNNKVDEDSATDLDNYTFEKEFEEAELLEDGKTVVLTLEDKDEAILKNQKQYELTIENVLLADSEIKLEKVEKEFVAVDTTIPYVKEVKGLGTKAIEVIFNEPVTKTTARRLSAYKVDGKALSGSVKYVYPNSVIISTNLTVGEHTLSVKDVEDFAEFKVQEAGFEFTIEKDNEAPEIVSAKSNDLTEVELTFNEPVKSISNAYHTSKANGAIKPYQINGKKVTLEFKTPMSLGNTTIYLENVEDYSGNKADRSIVITPELDLTRPEVVEVKVENGQEFTIVFSEKVNKDQAREYKNYVIKDEDGKVPSGVGLNSKGNPVVTMGDIELNSDGKEVTFKLRSPLDKGIYTIEISGIQDKAHIPNTMLPHTETFEVGDTTELKLEEAWLEEEENGSYKYVYIRFNKAVATEGDGNALVLSKYNYTTAYEKDKAGKDVSSWYPLPTKATIGLEAEDTVKIEFPKNFDKNIKGIRVTLVTDDEGNSFKDYQAKAEVKPKDARKIKLESAKVTAKDTVEATFSAPLVSVVDSDFSLVTVQGDVYYKVYFEEFKANNEKVAIFKIIEGKDKAVGEDVYGWKFVTAESPESVGRFGAKLVADTKGVEVIDAIRPTINKINAVEGKDYIELEFNEAVKTSGYVLGLTVKVNGEEYQVKLEQKTEDPKTLKVIFTNEEFALKAGDEVEVELKDVNDITDKADNTAEAFEDFVVVKK